jgi:hypothetical protein
LPKIKEIEIDGYYFPNINGLFWHSGSFWMFEEKVKQVENNGSLSILLYGSSKRSVAKLRKTARKCKVKLVHQKLPF